jgi:epimerase transport system membrane fusion protein
MDTRSQSRSLMRAGWWVVLGAVVPLCAWMALAPLSMAVVAPAFVKVDLNRRPVQHLEGGIVRSVLVRDGQRVGAGQTVLILGDVSVDAERNRLTYRAEVERAGIARLEAEEARAAVVHFPGTLLGAAKRDKRVQEAMAKEQSLFRARRDALGSETALLVEQRGRIDQESAALREQIGQVRASLELQKGELELQRKLLKDGFISAARLAQLEAVVADYASKLEERRSELARAAQRRGDVDLRAKALANEYAKNASDQLKMANARLAEIEQELRKSQDAAARQVVTAPAAGEVIDLKFTSPGAVVRAGEPIADIVPVDANLVLEAQIRPEDVSNVRLEQPARIKFTAYKYRNLTMVWGKVTYVSADRLVDKTTNVPYYSVMITVDPQSLREAGELQVQAGMPAEVYIEGSRQTPFQYLAEPITSTIRKAGRQL